ncbi:MAG: response regulator [Candidatus Omnitrophica bacterium]|nr:response regulator [Candidatus Omnitrophota bacterium]
MNLRQFSILRASDIMARKVVTAPPGDTVREAVRKMSAANVGSVVVVDDKKNVLGIFTERDIMKRVVGEGKDPGVTVIKDVMTTDPETLVSSTSVSEIFRVINTRGFRHVIIKDGGVLSGMVSARDLSRLFLELIKEMLFDGQEEKKAPHEKTPSILFIDDEIEILNGLSELFEKTDYKIYTALTGGEGLDIYWRDAPDIVFTDIMMPGVSGLRVLEEIKKAPTNTEVCIITGHGTLESAIQSMEAGAFDYLIKPVDFSRINMVVKRALEKQKLKRELAKHIEKIEGMNLELKTQQLQIIQAAKLTAIGELGAGVAHEMNQPLMAISTNMESLLMNDTVNSDEKLKTKLAKLKDQFVRLSKIVRRMHEYSGQRMGGVAPEDISRPVKDAVYLFGQQFKDHNIALTMDCSEDPPKVEIDRYQIQDVVVNLLVNARDAVDERFKQYEGGAVDVFTKKHSGGLGVIVAVIDNGIPVKEGTETDIFNMFFTTKPVGKGTGIGLSVCHNIIKRHSGIIGFQLLAGGRKMFYFMIPFDKKSVLVRSPEIEAGIVKEFTE